MSWLRLRQDQKDAVKRMHNGCILCGGVGSGKSITALAYYYLQMGGELNDNNQENYIPMDDVEDRLKDLYIITTAHKRDTCEWEAELSHFLLSPNPEANLYSNKVVIDSWNNIKKYKDVQNAFFIFDEQRVVGYGAWTKSFLNIAKHNQWILLSATPGDKWPDYISVFIANGFYKNKSEFERNHIIYKYNFNSYPKIDRYVGLKRLVRLRERILVDMDFNRHTIPHHEPIMCHYDIAAYKDLCKNRWNPWKDEPIDSASDFCYALRRIVNSDESRQLAILEILEKHPKAIIFYNFDYELDVLKEVLSANNYPVAEWNGHKHQEMPTGDKWVYLVQYLAGAEGWNCVTTDTIIFYSQTYSYKTLIQACGRIDRMNTPFIDLYYYHLRSKAGIDLAIGRALKNKKKFNERKFYDGK